MAPVLAITDMVARASSFPHQQRAFVIQGTKTRLTCSSSNSGYDKLAQPSRAQAGRYGRRYTPVTVKSLALSLPRAKCRIAQVFSPKVRSDCFIDPPIVTPRLSWMAIVELFHQQPFAAHRVQCLQQERSQQLLRRDRRPPGFRVQLVESWLQFS